MVGSSEILTLPEYSCDLFDESSAVFVPGVNYPMVRGFHVALKTQGNELMFMGT